MDFLTKIFFLSKFKFLIAILIFDYFFHLLTKLLIFSKFGLWTKIFWLVHLCPKFWLEQIIFYPQQRWKISNAAWETAAIISCNIHGMKSSACNESIINDFSFDHGPTDLKIWSYIIMTWLWVAKSAPEFETISSKSCDRILVTSSNLV